MYNEKFFSNYDKYPEIKVEGYDNEAWQGYKAIYDQLSEDINKINNDKIIITIECYPAVRYEELLEGFINKLKPTLKIFSDDLALSGEKISKLIDRNLTDDRVFGVISHHIVDEFFINDKVQETKKEIEKLSKGLIIIYGVGASLINEGDILLYADLARWEIQQRYRSQEFGNWKMKNYKEDILKKYKRGFFVEWRVADRIKKNLFDQIDYLLDTNLNNNPKMITGKAFLTGLAETVKGPYRMVPFFDSGVWGGQWMKEVCDLDKEKDNFAWCFDGVPEENSIYMKYGNIKIEIPAINIVFRHPIELLGDKVHARFGAEFPIRFDLLDTMEGQNLSLQVHPLTEYIQETFGMHYTQDESYYLLDAGKDACVYLGTKKDIEPDVMIGELKRAKEGEQVFPAEKYINKFSAKKHDHFLIPAGTIHCSGSNSMVLEISATPYIFTFKLWDWERVGLDGLPRPVHIEHGEKVIQWQRDTDYVKANLMNRVEVITEGDGWREEKTGLHEREFIETRRHWFREPVLHNTKGSVNVLNLIEGQEAIVTSPTNSFEPFIVHYAETFIIPASVNEYIIKPYGKSEGREIATIKAYVRT